MSSLHLFRKVAMAEVISYIVLLLIAMPLKYLANFPLAVNYVGWAHGLLFVLYIACLIMAWQERKWSFWKVVALFVASLLPFVPFYIEKKLKHEENLKN